MLNIGIFTNSLNSIDLYQLTSNSALYSVRGICLLQPHNEAQNPTQIEIFDDTAQLLPLIDVALIEMDDYSQVEIAVLAIKSGADTYIANSQDLTLPTLNQLEMFAREIGVKLGFGQLGYNIGTSNLHIEHPIIAQIKRNTSIASAQHFDSIIKFDIATALNLTKNKIRKIRAYSVPTKTPIPATLFVLIDFDNNSAITYTLSNTDENSSFEVELHHSTQTLHFEIPEPDTLSYKQIDFDQFLECTSNNSEPEKGVELASNTVFVVETIYSKIG